MFWNIFFVHHNSTAAAVHGSDLRHPGERSWIFCQSNGRRRRITWSVMGTTEGTRPHMKKFALITALFLATSPVAAQQATIADQQQQPLAAGGQTVTSPLTNTGTICQEEMVATFCNVATSPNTAGHGSNGGAAATSAGITTPSPAIPACGEGIVTANELCN
jgi:hypothetical protein